MTSLTERTALLVVAGVGLAALKSFGPFLWPYQLGPAWSPASQAWFFFVDLLWVAAMLVTYRRDPTGPMWKLFLLYQVVGTIGVVWIVPNSLAWTLSQLSIGIGSVVFVHLVLAFPSGRLTDRYDRFLVVGAYVLIAVTRLAWLVTWDPGPVVDKVGFSPRNPYVIWPDSDLAWLFGPGAFVAIAPLLYLAVMVGLWRHWRRASPALRRALLPITVAAPIQLAIIVGWHLADADASGLETLRSALQQPVIGLAAVVFPVGFLLGLLRTRLSRGAISDLALDLAAASRSVGFGPSLPVPFVIRRWYWPSRHRLVTDSSTRPGNRSRCRPRRVVSGAWRVSSIAARSWPSLPMTRRSMPRTRAGSAQWRRWRC